jgi:hypothetical protein
VANVTFFLRKAIWRFLIERATKLGSLNSDVATATILRQRLISPPNLLQSIPQILVKPGKLGI